MSTSAEYATIKRQLDNPESREEGLELLSKSSIRTAAALASKHLRDSNEFVRTAALECLLIKGSKRYCGAVEKNLKDEYDVARHVAIECLAEWQCRKAIPKIARLMEDPDPLVRSYAPIVIGSYAATVPGTSDEKKYLSALERALENEEDVEAVPGILTGLALLTRDQNYEKELLTLLNHENAHTQYGAARGLEHIANENNVERIRAALRETFNVSLGKKYKTGVREVVNSCLVGLSDTFPE